ncbi:MAG TPA: hypothetical protein VJV78_09470 [Polyangiales bacterium]|nr:hypothetical protein [Polyangiales bacterium]
MSAYESERVVLNQIAFVRVEDVLIQCIGQFDAGEEDFASWLTRLRAEDYRVLLISARGNGGLSAKQRGRVAEFWKTSGRTPPRVALLSESTVARGVLIAIGWLLDNPTKAFAPHDLRSALAFLGTSASHAVIATELDMLHAGLQAKARRSA